MRAVPFRSVMDPRWKNIEFVSTPFAHLDSLTLRPKTAACEGLGNGYKSRRMEDGESVSHRRHLGSLRTLPSRPTRFSTSPFGEVVLAPTKL